MKDKVLVTATNYSKYCAPAKALLESRGFEIVENEFGRPMTFEELKERVPEVCAVVVGVDTWNERVFELAPKLKIMGRFGIGVDNIDLAAAKKHGIKVMNARGVNADSVAEYTIALILSVLRNVVVMDRSTRGGQWVRGMAHTIRGKKVGLVGFGAISQYLAKLLSGFGAELYACDMYPNREAAACLGVAITDLDSILRECDIVSLHVPGTPETTKLIGAKQFAMMKPNAVLINTARGQVVDQASLVAALKEKRIAGAGLDVFESEPTAASNPLFGLDNVVVGPHTAAETYETYEAVSMATAKAILDVMAGKDPQNWLNP
jgi:D-3-phosphoglycerate dehydrogenase